MSVSVATFTPRAPVALFESARISVGTTFESLLQPLLYAEVDARNEVFALRNSTAVITALRLTNTSGSARRVDFRVLSSRRITYEAEVTAGPGENWLRLDRVTRPRGVQVYGYDWSAAPPVRLTTLPDAVGQSADTVAWTSDSRYLATTQQTGSQFQIFDADNDFATVFASVPVVDPVRVGRAAWSADGRYLAVTYRNTQATDHPPVKVFDFVVRNAPVEVALPQINARVTAIPQGVTWGGPSNRYMVISNAGVTRYAVYDWNTGSPVFASGLTDSLQASTSGFLGRQAAFSPDGALLAVSHSGNARLTVFTFPTATTISPVNNAIFGANTRRLPPRNGLAWTDNSRYLACLSGPNALVPFTVYDFLSGVSVLPAPAQLPPLPALECAAWSRDGRYLVVGHGEAARYTYYPLPLPYLLLYDYDSGSPVRVTANPRLQGDAGALDVAFSPDGDTLMVAGVSFDRFYPPTGVDNVRLLDDEGANYVINGSFEDTDGLERTDFGFRAINEIPGWRSDNADIGDGETIFLPNRRFVNAFATTGSVYLDVVGLSLYLPRRNDVRLRQTFDTLTEGETYKLQLDVTASQESDIGVRAVWNGTAVNFEGAPVLPDVDSIDLAAVDVPAGASIAAPLAKHMLNYGDALQIKASGAGVTAVVSCILSTQEEFQTLQPIDPVGDPEE